MVNFNTDKLIILYYPSYAGGKFLSNCLSLSKHAVSQCPLAAGVEFGIHAVTDVEIYRKQYNEMAGSDWPSYDKFILGDFGDTPAFVLAEFSELSEINSMIGKIRRMLERRKKFAELSYYEYKLYVAMDSLPLTKEHAKKWTNHEYGCDDFFGVRYSDYLNNGREVINKFEFNAVIHAVSNSSKCFFQMAHSIQEVKAYLTVWPNAKVVSLKNYHKFRDIAVKIKKAPEDLSEDNGNVSGALTFDVSTYFDKDRFSVAVSNLYTQLGFDDFNSNSVEQFRAAYMELHRLD